jgi:probable F420-dependent oxidoreductase
LIIGYRPIVQQAKAWFTLDHLSGGRAIFGAGVGWMREEFDALGMPWDHRGERADEALEILQALWSERTVQFNGKFTSFGPVGFEPKPANGRIPVWIGGHTDAAYRRAARYADAFHGALCDLDKLASQWRGVRDACEQLGRDPSSIELTQLSIMSFGAAPPVGGAIAGTPSQMVDLLGRYAELGVTHTVVMPSGEGGLEHRLDDIRRFATDVMPQLA